MASATRAVEVVEEKTVTIEVFAPVYTLKLTEEEAIVISALRGACGGRSAQRQILNGIAGALSSAGAPSHELYACESFKFADRRPE